MLRSAYGRKRQIQSQSANDDCASILQPQKRTCPSAEKEHQGGLQTAADDGNSEDASHEAAASPDVPKLAPHCRSMSQFLSDDHHFTMPQTVPSSRSCSGSASQKPTQKHIQPKRHTPKSEQLFLDFGQQSFGEHSTCRTCGMMYERGNPADESCPTF